MYKGKQREPSNSCEQKQGSSVRSGRLSIVTMSGCVYELHQFLREIYCLLLYKETRQIQMLNFQPASDGVAVSVSPAAWGEVSEGRR